MKAVTRVALALGLCALALMLAAAGTSAHVSRSAHVASAYDPATQSHPGACSQTTLNVAQAVRDLSANGVLGQYAAMVGVHATGADLLAQMRRTLVVERVAATTVTANHGCTTDGLIFGVGNRTLTAGETVGVAIPSRIRNSLCAGSSAGCERKVLTFHRVFPTNCWNLDVGHVRIVVYVHRPKVKVKVKVKPKPKPKVLVPRPSARVATTCGVGNPGYATVTLGNGAGASARAYFTVNGHAYGPVAAGGTLKVTVALGSAMTTVKVSSGGQVLVDQSIPADQCAVAPASSPTATAALSCSAGGVVVTLTNGTAATADATFAVNGTTYGPLAPGESQTVTVPVSPGSSGQVTVTSGARTLLDAVSYSNACAAGPAATAALYCSPPIGEGPTGGGVVVLQLSNGATATLPAMFDATVTGSTTTGYSGSIGPVAAGATQTLLVPVDASGNPITVTVGSAGTQLIDQTFPSGCSQNLPPLA